MKKGILVMVALVALAAGATLAATAVTGGASSSGCRSFTWTSQSTARNFDGTYHESGNILKGDLKGGTYDLHAGVNQSGAFITGTGTLAVNLGSDTMSFQNAASVKFSGTGPLGGIAFAESGTGPFSGASGDFVVTGVFDSNLSNQTAVSRTYSGQLCLP
jgi:hypothetical protein